LHSVVGRISDLLNASRKPDQAVWKAWIPALLWLGFITIESTSILSSENTGKVLYPLLHFLLGLDPFRFVAWHFVLRKTGHVIGYGTLSILLFRAWRATIPVRCTPRWSIVWARTAFSMTMLVASLDEWHQTFLPSRTGSMRDVLLDIAAALATQVFLFLWHRPWHEREPRPPRDHAAFTASDRNPTTHEAPTSVSD
jgi:VanZ family protein